MASFLLNKRAWQCEEYVFIRIFRENGEDRRRVPRRGYLYQVNPDWQVIGALRVLQPLETASAARITGKRGGAVARYTRNTSAFAAARSSSMTPIWHYLATLCGRLAHPHERWSISAILPGRR